MLINQTTDIQDEQALYVCVIMYASSSGEKKVLLQLCFLSMSRLLHKLMQMKGWYVRVNSSGSNFLESRKI